MLHAMEGKSRKITKVERKDHRLYLYSDMGIHRIEPKSQNTARITYTSRDTFSNKEKPGVINLSVYSDWEYRIQQDSVYYQTDNLIIQINLETASYQYFDRQGKLLLSERKKESKNLEECVFYKLQEEDEIHKEKVFTADGVKEIVREATRIPHETLYHTRLYLEWQEQEALYGMGQQEEGILNLRGHMVFLHQANRKITIPLLVSNLGYGILMDTYSPLIFSDTIYGSYLYTEADYEMDFYFINGGNIDGVIGEYRRLTGKASLLPKWAYGYIQSQERYETAEEILQVAEEYRRRKIGLDGIVLDWCYWKENLWGQKTFDPNRFQNPTEMIEQLHSMNVHFMISIWPNMSEESEDYQEFKEQGLLLPGSNVYNPLRKEGRELYWKQAKNGLFCHGVDAWWCDSSEPFTPEWNHMSRVEPSVMYQEYCETSGMHLPASEMNNFALYHAMTMYEGQRSEEKVVGDEKRVINLTRSGYIGGQRYGTILWSGDTDASWDTLRKQIAAGLNFCASGLPYWTMDIGGFFIKKGQPWYWNGDYREGSSDLGFRELFVRWYQLGCFYLYSVDMALIVEENCGSMGIKGMPSMMP